MAQCRQYSVPLWQCPQFLFLIMGIIIIGSTLIAYAVGTNYIEEPELVALIAILIAVILLIIAALITRSFERLAEANRMKSEFINIISHQLRSPLTNLKWTIDFLMSGRLGKIEKKQIEYFKILKENSDRMANLVSDLLTVSRLETATLLFKKQEISLEALVKKIIKKMKPFIQASNVQVFFDSEPNLPKILADPYQISQTIENLLDNAIRYSKGLGRIEIKTKKKNKNLYFEIKDNGCGIPREDQKYIFQKFFRSKNVFNHQTQGTGLGLYIAKAIIERAAGRMGFNSEENKGSTFWFTLPIHPVK